MRAGICRAVSQAGGTPASKERRAGRCCRTNTGRRGGNILHNGYNAVATEGTAAQRRQVTCQDPERDPGPGDSEASSFLLNSKGLSHFINVSFSLRSATDQEFSHVLLAPGAYRAAAPGGCIVGDRPPRSWLPEVSGDSCRSPSEFQEWHHVPGVSLRSSKERA